MFTGVALLWIASVVSAFVVPPNTQPRLLHHPSVLSPLFSRQPVALHATKEPIARPTAKASSDASPADQVGLGRKDE